MTDHSITGKNVLIAGGAKNLGGLLSRDLATHGAKGIAIHYNSAETAEEAEQTRAAAEAAGATAVLLNGDLTTGAAVQSLFEDAIAALGSLDIAINTVGKVRKDSYADLTEADYDSMQAINAKSAFLFIKEAGACLNDHGKIVSVTTSLLGAFTKDYALYAGMKAPLEHYTRAAAQEFGARGISVNAIGPGPMDTNFFYPQEGMLAQQYHKHASALSKFSKTGLTDPEDIVPWIRLMVSEGWWMTGQTILVNGGYTTK